MMKKNVPVNTAIVWGKMVNFRRTSAYGGVWKNCGDCVHRGSAPEGSHIFGCNLHTFIPMTTKNNICDEWASELPEEAAE